MAGVGWRQAVGAKLVYTQLTEKANRSQKNVSISVSVAIAPRTVPVFPIH